MKPVKFTTTGLSSLEKDLIAKIFETTEYKLDETMSSSTSYLLAYKNIFTEKRILAERWSIPVISVLWVYKSLALKNIMQFRLRKYEGCVFCTSGITNDLFVNYYKLNGAYHSSVLSRYCDFLLVNTADQVTEKVIYAREWGIPIIPSEYVFDDRVSFFLKNIQYESLIHEPLTDEIFNGKTFYFEGDTAVHKLVRRLVIEHGGNRVEEPGPDVTYSIYFGGAKKRKNLIWYHWILDSAELGTLLSLEGYAVDEPELLPFPLTKSIIFPMVCKEEALRTRNKVHALGGEVSLHMSSKITHCIVERKEKPLQSKVRNYLKMYKISVCSLEWLNQSIYYMKRLNEAKFELFSGLRAIPEVTLEKKEALKRATVKYISSGLDGWTVQFTGLTDALKGQAIAVLKAKGATVIDSAEYAEACTHLIVGAVNVSLKFLSAIASGCVLMDYKVIDDLKQNAYTKESDYALNTRDLKIDAHKNEKIIRKLIMAAPGWKAKKELSEKRAFSDWTVLVLAEKDKEKIEQLISNGGGVVLNGDIKENMHSGIFYFVDNASSVSAEIPSDKIVQIKDIILYLAGIKQNV